MKIISKKVSTEALHKWTQKGSMAIYIYSKIGSIVIKLLTILKN